MTELNLGVIEVPYDDGGKPAKRKVPKKPRKGKAKAPPTSKGSTEPVTTVNVAHFLEDKYHVMEIFYRENQDEILGAMIHGLEGALEDLYAGAPIGNPFAEVDDEISAAFRVWLMQAEIEKLGIPGVPTKAALEGRSLRFKNKRGERRPSFIDTGLYETAFRSWIE